MIGGRSGKRSEEFIEEFIDWAFIEELEELWRYKPDPSDQLDRDYGCTLNTARRLTQHTMTSMQTLK